MKKTIISILAACLLGATGYAQLSFGPFTGSTGVAVSGELTFGAVGTVGTLTYRINNLSDGVNYTYGDLTGFSIGFDATKFTYKIGSFDVLNLDGSFSIVDDSAGNSVGFELGNQSGPPAFFLDVSAKSTSNALALDGGFWAEFEFEFDILGGATFDADTFFDAAPALALSWRFQSVGDDREDSDAFGAFYVPDDGGGGGFGVPEPSTYGLFGALALLGLMVVRQVRRR